MQGLFGGILWSGGETHDAELTVPGLGMNLGGQVFGADTEFEGTQGYTHGLTESVLQAAVVRLTLLAHTCQRHTRGALGAPSVARCKHGEVSL
jgi:hypothetical protein